MTPNNSTKIINFVNYTTPNKGECMSFTNLDMCYLAGIFDGDGSFSLIKKVENEKRSPLYYPTIQLGAKGDDLINLLKDQFGGYKILSRRHTSKDRFERNDFFRFKLEKPNQCKPFLEKVTPYLKLKKDRAEFLLKYIEENPFKRGSNKLIEEVIFQREKAWLKMKELNSESMLRHASLSRNDLECKSNEQFWSYIAGLMDSDGSFSINKSGYWPVIQLSMIDVRGINFLNHHFIGGKVNVLRAKTCKTGMTYRWSTKNLDICTKFLTSVIPFLRVKKNVAQCLLEFIAKRESTKERRAGVPKDQQALRQYYHQKIKCINKYGVFKPALIDLEGREQADRGEGESHAERLNERACESMMR